MTAAAKYRLVVSDQLEFIATIVLQDGAVERSFRMRLSAKRTPGNEADALLAKTPLFTDFLATRELALLAWEGDAPLKDAAGQPAPADAEALQALLLEQGMPNALFAAYMHANGARAKLGN